MMNWLRFPGTLYTCWIHSLITPKIDGRKIESFRGAHIIGKSDEDVKAVLFFETVLNCFPRGLQKIFPQIIIIHIQKSGLKEIFRHDLKGLENLEMISIKYNELTTLPSNLFENMPKLKVIILERNKLEFVSSKLLRPVMNNGLTYVDFSKNKNIDYFFALGYLKSVPSIDVLMKIIDTKCKRPKKEKFDQEDESKKAHASAIQKGLEKLWMSGNFSDFTIIVNLKKFCVHKWVLRIHSQVFAEKFAEKIDNVNEMKIEDVSEEAVYDFLRYLYIGELPDKNNLMDAFALAVKLKADELKSISETIICKNILNNSNAYKVFMLGHVYAAEKIKLAAFNRIRAMFPDANLPNRLMQEPERLKKIMEHKQDLDHLLRGVTKMSR